jgi:hypothetical protein
MIGMNRKNHVSKYSRKGFENKKEIRRQEIATTKRNSKRAEIIEQIIPESKRKGKQIMSKWTITALAPATIKNKDSR